MVTFVHQGLLPKPLALPQIKRALVCTSLPRPTPGTSRPETLAALIKKYSGSPVWSSGGGRQGEERKNLILNENCIWDQAG